MTEIENLTNKLVQEIYADAVTSGKLDPNSGMDLLNDIIENSELETLLINKMYELLGLE